MLARYTLAKRFIAPSRRFFGVNLSNRVIIETDELE